ncbi:MAG: hypothetical protein LUI04_02850 [Porphyromonadaceae bacterium]|nr:hypothetical protein [Porphyromonadaceae bacterium]
MAIVILLSLIIVAISVLLMGVKIFFVRGGRFPETHIGNNPQLKKRGITCALSTDFADRHSQHIRKK